MNSKKRISNNVTTPLKKSLLNKFLQRHKASVDNTAGFSLTELILVIVILALVSAVAIPKMGEITNNARRSATEKEMMELVRAIIGDASQGFRGYYDDMGRLPVDGAPGLVELYTQDAQADYDPLTQTGWNGPYIDVRERDGNIDILYDAWGNAYVYAAGAATITSTGGGGGNIVVNIKNS
ncbi:MAG: type II secretion system GspH family protein [Candidatus Omnitrophica bacterium]|nr:type II secretion system GspH family protein [Candidatus Omnitrophota bacterium]